MACPSVALSAQEVHDRLRTLPHWQLNGQAIERIYDGQSYLDALDKLNAIARLSEEADHHPDLILSWKKLTIRYWTHTAKGITELDFKLAQQADAVLSG